MYSKYEVKCKDCDDIITLIYDSREKREKIQEYVTCKCGKLKAFSKWCGYSYNNEGSPEVVSHESKNLKEDYLILDEEIQEKYGRVKALAETLEFEESKYEDEIDGEGLIWHLSLSYGNRSTNGTNEAIEIELKLDLHQYEGWSEYKIDKFKEETIKRLDEFYKFLLKAKEDPKILTDKEYLWDTNEFKFEGNREQHNSYDYEFWF